MTQRCLGWVAGLLLASSAFAAKPPVYVWLEPEWFEGVTGSYAYWTGPGASKPKGSWGVAGPGISAEWTQGGESEWNSMGAAPEETRASCRRDFVVPRPGRYRVWVRYVDHREKTEPFKVAIRQGGKDVILGELGLQPVIPPNDEYELYWGFSFGWGAADGDLKAGPATILLSIDKAGEGWRQVDAVLITDDLVYTPAAREKPAFGYTAAMALAPSNSVAWRGSAKDLQIGASWKRPLLGNRDFSMWTGISDDPKWWGKQNTDAMTPYDVFFQFSAPADISAKFHEQFAGRKDMPIMSWPNLLPGFYLATPDLSPGTALRQWLERTKTPFFILTTYARPAYNGTNGPATYQALTGPLAGQFMGYIHGEAIGPPGVAGATNALGKTRREHVEAMGRLILKQEAEVWSNVYKTAVPESYWQKGIACLSSESIALCHLFLEWGAKVVGYEEDCTNVHAPMRIAFERGAARQYGRNWINYASANFGDSCNSFTQNPVTPRGALGWFHSKYAVTDGVSISWYRKFYYLNYLSGAAAIFWEQGLGNQWFLPGPGTHPVQLSPFGRATVDFQAFVDRLPDRGEPYTPVALLLSYGHGYERVNDGCKMLNFFTEDKWDIELRELFNVCWFPSGVDEGLPAAPDAQSLPSGIYGNIFDVLVDRPAGTKAVDDYSVVWAAGDVDLGGPWQPVIENYVKRGGTLVVNVKSCKSLSPKLLGLRFSGKTTVEEEWAPDGEPARETTPYEVAQVEMDGAKALAWAIPKVPLIARNAIGAGAVIVTLVPHMVGQDERAHPALPFLMNALTANLLPIEVRTADGGRLQGEVMYQINRTKDGWLVLLMNNQGVDKTQNGVARVNRRKYADITLRTALGIRAAKEYTQPRELQVEKKDSVSQVRVRVHPGDVQVVGFAVR